jgi:hypothetical protein
MFAKDRRQERQVQDKRTRCESYVLPLVLHKVIIATFARKAFVSGRGEFWVGHPWQWCTISHNN